MQTTALKRIEVLVDAPLARKVRARLDELGTTGYTVLPTVGGRGRSGPWWEDQVSGASNKLWFQIICTDKVADDVTEALAPFLEDYGLVLTISTVEVVRAGRF